MEHRSLTFIIGLLFSALAVSGVAAYFSIVGLMAIFNGLPYSILAMGIVLEIAKNANFAAPLTAVALQQFVSAAGSGLGNEDDAAVAKIYARNAGIQLPQNKT